MNEYSESVMSTFMAGYKKGQADAEGDALIVIAAILKAIGVDQVRIPDLSIADEDDLTLAIWHDEADQKTVIELRGSDL